MGNPAGLTVQISTPIEASVKWDFLLTNKLSNGDQNHEPQQHSKTKQNGGWDRETRSDFGRTIGQMKTDH